MRIVDDSLKASKTQTMLGLFAKRARIAVGSMVVFYFSGPLLAGFFEVGDKWGPKIYPIVLHENLYSLGWRLRSHRESKPRLGYWYRSEWRPWFYGLESENARKTPHEEEIFPLDLQTN